MTLFDLGIGETATIIKVRGRGAFRKRITEMGFVLGQEVTVIKKAPLLDPVEYRIMGYNVSLRNSEARLIEIITARFTNSTTGSTETFEIESSHSEKKSGEKEITIALVGNPNSGKTTLFNYASGSRERVGNYSGVTVGATESGFKLNGYNFIITDLPGTYSITAYSPEELYVRDFIFESLPDVVINIVDAGNLERNLYLTTQLIDMDIRVVVALNMFDDLERSGDNLNYEHLGEMLGVPFVPTVASKGRGIQELFMKVAEVVEDKSISARHIHIYYGNELEQSIRAVQQSIRIPENKEFLNTVSSRFLAIKLLEKDESVREIVSRLHNSNEIVQTSLFEIERVEKVLQEDSESLVTDAKYGFISGALAETLVHAKNTKRKRSESIDTLLTHKYWGIPIFIFLMWSSFYFTFKLGKYPEKAIQWGVDTISFYLQNYMAAGMFKDLLIKGILGGVGGVIIFLPNIVLLYLFISVMEDTGYMARAVFIMDKMMHKIGLHGKSFIPLVMGFGCNVPAILSTRIIESRRDRMITMLINPFMSCSARLPVYILFISAFFINYQGSILFLIYMFGIVLAILSALLFRKTIFRKKDLPFVMELPPYRVPTLRSILRHMWHRAVQYINKIAGVILIASIIIWALGYFPSQYKNKSSLTAQQLTLQKQYREGKIQDREYKNGYTDIQKEMNLEQQRNSYIGKIGSFIEPVMHPLGFDWKMSIAILTGISAKEVVVGTLGVLYQADVKVKDQSQNLITRLQTQKYSYGKQIGEKVFNPVVAMSFMLFILIYFPCIGVLSAISRESGSWKWALFIVIYTSIIAYLVSLAAFQIGSFIVR